MHKLVIVAGLVLLSLPAHAGELELGLYGGFNESAQSRGELSNGVDTQSSDLVWRGLSFEAPIYYGARLTYWPESLANWGFGIDFTHAKAYADLDQGDLRDSYSRLEFTDGLNLLTANAFYRHTWDSGFAVHGGVGAGISIPHVEVTTDATTVVGETATFEYQVTGPAFQAIAGASYEFAESWRVFGEYKLSYAAINNARLQGGGTFSTDIVSSHVLAGISYSFDAGGF